MWCVCLVFLEAVSSVPESVTISLALIAAIAPTTSAITATGCTAKDNWNALSDNVHFGGLYRHRVVLLDGNWHVIVDRMVDTNAGWHLDGHLDGHRLLHLDGVGFVHVDGVVFGHVDGIGTVYMDWVGLRDWDLDGPFNGHWVGLRHRNGYLSGDGHLGDAASTAGCGAAAALAPSPKAPLAPCSMSSMAGGCVTLTEIVVKTTLLLH